MPKRKDKWRLFENLVASIEVARQRGAEIKWNETINGRQFDVTIRTQIGPYVELTVVECKDYTKRAVSVEKVDALVTKACDAGAALAVLASRSGFQEGCLDVARRHGVQLLTVDQARSIPPDVLTGAITLAANVFGVSFTTVDETVIQLPEERNQLPWLLKHGTIERQDGKMSLEHLVQEMIYSQEGASSDSQPTPKLLRRELCGVVICLPDREGEISVSAMQFQLRMVQAGVMKPNQLDPWLVSKAYSVRDEVEETSETHRALDLSGSPSDRIVAGTFYFNPRLTFSYYCLGVADGIARMAMVESYQHGELMQVVGTMEVAKMTGYVRVTDREEIERLSSLLSQMNIRD